MDIDKFLLDRGTNRQAALKALKATIGFHTGDWLLGVGSVVEDLGNTKSDLDMLLISPRSPASLPSTASVTLIVGKCLIDVRVIRLIELNELLNRFHKWLQRPWNVTHAVEFSADERTLLHRVINGNTLFRPPTAPLRLRLPAQHELARLKLHVARHTVRTIQVDMAGYIESLDYDSLSFSAQEILGHAVDALCAGHGMTNPLLKWRNRLLSLVCLNWKTELLLRPTRSTAREYVWRLNRPPARAVGKPTIDYALRILGFARAVFIWAECRLVHSRAAPMLREWPRLTRRPTDIPAPSLRFDVDFCFSETEVILGRLNEFGRTLCLSMNDFSVVLLLDGVNTAEEADIAVNGLHKPGRIRRIIKQLADLGLVVYQKP